MRRVVLTAAVAFAVIAGVVSAQDSRQTRSLDRAFTANGRINLDLSAGEYRITPSRDNHIRLVWSVKDGGRLSDVRARADVGKQEANVSLDGPSDNFRAEIALPARSDLYVRLTAGELAIEGIEGNKDVAAHAGELDIDVGRAEDYYKVESSVWAGEIHATPYRISKEGLFRSIDWYGKGPYRLEARLKAGEIRLHAKPAK
jgi:hypothetical protein